MIRNRQFSNGESILGETAASCRSRPIPCSRSIVARRRQRRRGGQDEAALSAWIAGKRPGTGFNGLSGMQPKSCWRRWRPWPLLAGWSSVASARGFAMGDPREEPCIAAFRPTGKVAVVTGSAVRASAKSIAVPRPAGRQGRVSSRKAPACEEAAAEIRKAGGDAHGHPVQHLAQGAMREP